MKKNTIFYTCAVFFAMYFMYVIFFFFLKDDFLEHYSGISEKLKKNDYSVSTEYFNDYKTTIPLRKNLNIALIFLTIFFLIVNAFILKKRKSNYILGITICFIIIAVFILLISFLGILFYNSSPMIG